MKHIVILSGAGISRESGLQTFRDGDGLWEGHEVTSVATPEAWQRDPDLVQRFYNERRKGVLAAEPNGAHLALVKLEKRYRVTVVTQNIDDLHERAGSTSVVHLHGEIRKARSSIDDSLIYPIDGPDIRMGDFCELGSQLRPHVVWFGEPVPMMNEAIRIAETADVLLIVGTSLVVYPAASLIGFVPVGTEIYVVDPGTPALSDSIVPPGSSVECMRAPATKGVPALVERLLGPDVR